MLDPRPVAQQAMQGDYPQNWRVYHGYGDIESGCSIVLWVLTVVSMVGLAWYWLANHAWFADTPWVLAVPGLFFAGALALGREAASKRRSIFVFHPEGVVVCYGGDLKSLMWLSFPTIRKLEFAQKTTVFGSGGYTTSGRYLWLDVYLIDGSYLKWEMNYDFRDPEPLYKNIIAAYMYYQGQRTP